MSAFVNAVINHAIIDCISPMLDTASVVSLVNTCKALRNLRPKCRKPWPAYWYCVNYSAPLQYRNYVAADRRQKRTKTRTPTPRYARHWFVEPDALVWDQQSWRAVNPHLTVITFDRFIPDEGLPSRYECLVLRNMCVELDTLSGVRGTRMIKLINCLVRGLFIEDNVRPLVLQFNNCVIDSNCAVVQLTQRKVILDIICTPYWQVIVKQIGIIDRLKFERSNGDTKRFRWVPFLRSAVMSNSIDDVNAMIARDHQLPNATLFERQVLYQVLLICNSSIPPRHLYDYDTDWNKSSKIIHNYFDEMPATNIIIAGTKNYTRYTKVDKDGKKMMIYTYITTEELLEIDSECYGGDYDPKYWGLRS